MPGGNVGCCCWDRLGDAIAVTDNGTGGGGGADIEVGVEVGSPVAVPGAAILSAIKTSRC